MRVVELARREEASVSELTEAISSDPALVARILKFVNSPLAGVSRQVSSLKQAVTLMGMRGVKMMALSFSLVSVDRQAGCPSFDYDGFWSRSLACGVAARCMAEATGKHAPEAGSVAATNTAKDSLSSQRLRHRAPHTCSECCS